MTPTLIAITILLVVLLTIPFVIRGWQHAARQASFEPTMARSGLLKLPRPFYDRKLLVEVVSDGLNVITPHAPQTRGDNFLAGADAPVYCTWPRGGYTPVNKDEI